MKFKDATNRWSYIAEFLPGRSASACGTRYWDYIKVEGGVHKTCPWTKDEDKILVTTLTKLKSQIGKF